MGPRKKKRINVSGVVLTATPYKEQLKIQQTPKTNTHKRKLVATKEKSNKEKKKKENEGKKTKINEEKCHPKTNEKCRTGHQICCLVCDENYDADWIQCKTCEGWAHEDCATITDVNYY